jgi:hypothetical protein
VKRNGDPVLETPAIAESQAEMLHRLGRKSPIAKIRMRHIEGLQLKIQLCVYDHRQFPLRWCIRARGRCLPTRHSRRRSSVRPVVAGLWRQKLSLKIGCNAMEGTGILGIDVLHETGELQDVSLGAAAEALEQPTFQVCGEGGRSPSPVVIGERAEDICPIPLPFELDTIMGKDLREVELLPEGLEINPAHDVFSFRFREMSARTLRVFLAWLSPLVDEQEMRQRNPCCDDEGTVLGISKAQIADIEKRVVHSF